jgi:hypothetical protein
VSSGSTTIALEEEEEEEEMGSLRLLERSSNGGVIKLDNDGIS